MQVERDGPDGKVRTMEINISLEELHRGLALWDRGTLIQDAFPGLTDDEREFIKTGMTPEMWAALGED